MHLAALFVGILVVTGKVVALTSQDTPVLITKPRALEGIPNGSLHLIERNGCKKEDAPCGPGCCPKRGLCAIIGPGKFSCIVCDKDHIVCGGTDCCKPEDSK